MFRCKDSLKCIRVNDMCNGRADCIYGEDELLCDLPSCPKQCSCLQYAMSCASANFYYTSLVHMHFKYASITNGSINIEVLDMFGDLVVLQLHNNKLRTFCLEGIRAIPYLKSLDISSNLVSYGSQARNCFKPMPDMIMINLSYNHMKFLPAKLFTQNNKVELLDISLNFIISLQEMSLKRLNILKAFLFTQDHNVMIDRKTFSFSNVELIHP